MHVGCVTPLLAVTLDCGDKSDMSTIEISCVAVYILVIIGTVY